MSNRTRRLVLETAERLNYRPNSAARTLTTGKTANVGIVVPDTANPFFPSLIKGIQARAARGTEVPGGLSVVGNDGIAFASMVSPALTTVALPGASAGRAALDLLSGLLEDPVKRKEPPTMVSTHRLVRHSTAPAATGVAATGPAATGPAATGVAARRVAPPR